MTIKNTLSKKYGFLIFFQGLIVLSISIYTITFFLYIGDIIELCRVSDDYTLLIVSIVSYLFFWFYSISFISIVNFLFKLDDTKKNFEGLKTSYYENKQIKEEYYYKDGKKNGKWILYYYNGQIEEKRNYKDGKEDGKRTWYNETGQIVGESNYKDEKLDGKYTYYYENGQIREDKNYKDGIEDGEKTSYYENGQIKNKVNYKDGNPISTKED